MDRFRFHSHSLKARVTLLTLLIVVTAMATLGAYARWLLQGELFRFVGEQQHSALSLLCGQVSQGVQDRVAALDALASQVPARAMTDRRALLAFTHDRQLPANLFNNGVLVWNRSGMLLADGQLSPGVSPARMLDAQALAPVLQQGRTLHTIMRAPAADSLFMVVPIRTPQGAIAGALAGVIRLDQANFLNQLTAQAYGATGNFFVIEPRHRLIFATSDKRRLMEVLPAPGISPWIDRFMQGFEGSARVVNPHGVEVLVSVQQIPIAGWYASVTLSPDEAFGLLRAVVPRGLLAALVLGLLCVSVIWLMLERQLSPMTAAVRKLAGFVKQHEAPQPLQVVRNDEIGQLVSGFNQLLETLTQQQKVLLQSEIFKQAVLNSVTAEIAVLDANGVILAVNDAWRRSELPAGPHLECGNANVGSDYLAICDAAVAEPEDAEGMSVGEGIREVLNGRLPHFHKEYPCHTLRQQRWGGISVTPLERDTSRGVVVRIENITERVQMQNQLNKLAFYDPLTGLPNRRLVLDRLTQEIARARRAQSRVALLFVDLDKFKQVNDEQGHDVGDWLLQAVARRITACLRESDTPGRLGGDEFVVVLPDLVNPQAAMLVAEKIRLGLAQDFVTSRGTTLHVTSSIGVALYPDHADNDKDLLRLCDEAMYQAKKGGRNAVSM